MHPHDLSALIDWFQAEKRAFPWREDPSPYAVLVSEVMLQQTQASVVIPYFERWMERFPTIAALAQAPIEEVIKMWEGLGYYSRARNLHLAASELMGKNKGEIPSSLAELTELKGIGAYTSSAILSFAFHQKAAAVDGNVLRVCARYFAIEEDIAKRKTQQEIERRVMAFLPDDEPWVAMEALIELGAQLCQRTPHCSSCPLQEGCLAYKENKTHLLPFKAKKGTITTLFRSVLVLTDGQEVLLRQEKGKKVMRDLYEFPYLESAEMEPDKLQRIINKSWGLSALFDKKLQTVKHGFTRYEAHLFPSLWRVKSKLPVEGCRWVSWRELGDLPFSAGHRRILSNLGLSDAHFTH
jgi:A/G-specific adenine glycosylase